jgi:hypothetical protein
MGDGGGSEAVQTENRVKGDDGEDGEDGEDGKDGDQRGSPPSLPSSPSYIPPWPSTFLPSRPTATTSN